MPNCENKYFITNYGNVYSYFDFRKNKIKKLKPGYHPSGHCNINICINGESTSRKIH
ncbi:MAG: hypothetical protein ACOCRK_02550 [bacterium]